MKRSFLLLTAAALALVSCGGGGGDGLPFEGGVWYGDATLVEDTCEQPVDYYIYYTHLINQDGNDIVIDNGAMSFAGDIDENGAISARATRPYRGTLAGMEGCEELITWRYDQVEGDVAGFVVRASQVTCTDGIRTVECRTVHTGTASRANPYMPQPVYEGGVSDTML